MKSVLALTAVLLIIFVVLDYSEAWSGHFQKVRRSHTYRTSYCASWFFWWGCSRWRYYWRTDYYYVNQCQHGWTHNGNQNCIIPICRPTCRNGGTCVRPNVCNCPSTATGPGCAAFTCSYRRPCYPGNCEHSTVCTCEPGFIKNNSADGCIIFDSSYSELKPTVGKSNVTLSNIRRTDNRTDFMFILEGLEEEDPGTLEIIWSNQKRFNNLRFEYESYFTPPEEFPDRPNYVHESDIGIVESVIEANISKVSRSGSPIRDPGSFKIYKCEGGFSKDNPETELATCIIDDDQFRTLIEHGDWLNIKFKTLSGGFQKLVNIDHQSVPYATKYYHGLQDAREVQFNFDFIAPKHCSEPSESSSCPQNAAILHIKQEFTKDPIDIYWLGWTDDLSGVWEYYIEVFKLSPDPYNRLIEMEPLSPVYRITIPQSNITYPTYRPVEPGMYSVLMETRDFANNSRIARRLVLFDDQSEITLNNNTDGKLYVSSAVEETGYMWQTSVTGKNVQIDVKWQRHFINKIIEDNKLLTDVQPYPIQFKEIQDDGVLYSQKFVNDSLDDHEGQRTRDKIQHFHGIVKFETVKVFTVDDQEPTHGWVPVSPLEERTSYFEKLADGTRVRIWVRATDAMGNVKTDSTLVTFDGTPPRISTPGTIGATHEFIPNVQNATFNYTSRIKFTAADDKSGVHKIGFSIIIKTRNKNDRVIYEGFVPASTDKNTDNPLCTIIEGKCFIPQQSVDLDNCWFMISKTDLETSTATINVTAYNQALLTASTLFEAGQVKHLHGLEKYNGPENMRIESPTKNGFRLAWDLPEKSSCYGRAEIVIILFRKTAKDEMQMETYYAPGTSKYFDILGLDPDTFYRINLGMKMPTSSAVQETGISLDVKTPGKEEAEGNTGLVVGVAISVLVIVAIVVVVMIFLIRRGYLHPAQRAETIRRALTQRVRNSYATLHPKPGTSGTPKVGYDNRQSELYIYGGMDMNSPQIWHIDRNDVTFESMIKSGHFANIYKAKLKRSRGSGDAVVAKTMKEGFTADDELLMKAKINFTGLEVEDHPNILKFIGAVVGDDAMGPFIIYEYCEHGPLRDFLADRKNNLTLDLEENLFRFGLDIAKGMEYLAGKGIVHRRLAARNILLTFLNEVKISGFGPQPSEEDGRDAEKAKKERIPIKWMAPECMESTKDATEKSDVWSYAVVLWEIFSLGETPYTGKGTDLPKRLQKGERLEKPEQCDDTWYAVMKKCWAYEAKNRPTFSDIRGELDNLFVASPGDDYYFYKR